MSVLFPTSFTDGVTEALSPSQEEFGEKRLRSISRQVVNLPVKQIILRISEEVRGWIADAPQHDDLTFIAMRMH